MLLPVLRTLSAAGHALVLLATATVALLSCVALLSQAVRTSPSRSWTRNYNALIIGASYVVVLSLSLLWCAKRRVSVHQKLQRISKRYRIINNDTAPGPVHDFMTQEYIRACVVAFESQPKDAYHPGWGRPGTDFEGIRFRRALLDTIADIDTLAHLVIPNHPPLKPNARMLHHFRFIIPLLSVDQDELTPLHYYDSAIQLARNSRSEPTEEEFEMGMLVADDIKQSLHECWEEMNEASSTKSNRAGELVP